MMKNTNLGFQIILGIFTILIVFGVGCLVMTQTSAEVKVCDEKYGVNNWTIEDAGQTVNVMNPWKETPKKGIRCVGNGTRTIS